MSETHWIPGRPDYSGGRFKAVCGALVMRQDHRSDPSCEGCQRWMTAEDVATSKVIGRITPAEPFGQSVHDE